MKTGDGIRGLSSFICIFHTDNKLFFSTSSLHKLDPVLLEVVDGSRKLYPPPGIL